MYPNISNDEGIMTREKHFDPFAHKCKHFPLKELLIKLLDTIMNKHFFKFRSTWWVQKYVKAIGTPCAYNYATIVFTYFKRANILPTFKSSFLLFLRFIDNIFIV